MARREDYVNVAPPGLGETDSLGGVGGGARAGPLNEGLGDDAGVVQALHVLP